MPLNEQAKKGVIVLARVIDPYYHGDMGLLVTMDVKKSTSGIP